jgi:hypothetical protein
MDDNKAGQPTAPGRGSYWQAAMVVIICLLVTAGLVWGAASSSASSERSLLRLQVRQAVTALSGELTPDIQTPLLSAYELGTTEGTTTGPFQSFAASYVPGHFVSLSLLHTDGAVPTVISTIGAAPALLTDSSLATRELGTVRPSTTFSVVLFRTSKVTHLGFYETPTGGVPGVVIYAEATLPSTPNITEPTGSPYADLNFVAYLGPVSRSNLFLTTTGLPLRGTTTMGDIPFGNTKISVVATAQRSLEGALPRDLPWIVAIAGVLLALLGGAVTERFIRRRDLAERLAVENSRLYGEQRTIASTLQEALLPADLPTPPGMEVSARYLPGVKGLEVGGDWYDLIESGDDQFVFVVGDVAGRGLEAATTMASLRFALRAFTSQGDAPDVALGGLGHLLDFETKHQFATILCGRVDVKARRVDLASAGHIPPVLSANGSSKIIEVNQGPPVGTPGMAPHLQLTSLTVPVGATLLCFTDGLVERRGEVLDAGLERLRATASECDGTLDQVLDHVVQTLSPQGASDDIAIMGIRWLP